MNKLIVNLDATALGHSACIKDLYLTVIGELDEAGQSTGGYKEKSTSASLIYGVAIHDYLNVAYKTKGDLGKATRSAIRAFDIPKKEASTKQSYLGDSKHMQTVGYNIWNDYCLVDSSFSLIELLLPCYVCKGSGTKTSTKDSDPGMEAVHEECPNCKGEKALLQPASEVTFSIKYYEGESVVINLCGTIDKIGKIHNGCYAIGDWKTTSSWDNEGYFQQFELSRQLRVYLLALRLMASIQPDSTLGKIGATQVGCFIDAIFLKASANDIVVKRSDVFQISNSDLDAFQLTLDEKIEQLVKSIKTGYIPKEGILNGSCAKTYSKCAFWDCCRSNNQVERILLKQNFKQWKFEPLKYNE